MKRASVTVMILGLVGLFGLGIGAAPRYIEELAVGGGYGNTGAWIEADGDILTNGNLTVDGSGSFGGGYGSTGVTVTDAGNVSTNGTLTVDGVATVNNRMVVSRGGSVFIGSPTTGQNQIGSDQRNVGIGELVLPSLTTGQNIVAIGRSAGFNLTNANEVMAIGAGAFVQATSNSRLTGVGTSAGANITTGTDIVAIGHNAGRYRGTGTDTHTSGSQGTYIGASARAEASGGTTNEIVIGYNAVGAGSNTATLGNTSLTGVYTSADLFLRGGDAHFGVTGTTRGVSNHYRGASTTTPGATMLEARDGTDYYLWMGADGRMRRHTSLPIDDTYGWPITLDPLAVNTSSGVLRVGGYSTGTEAAGKLEVNGGPNGEAGYIRIKGSTGNSIYLWEAGGVLQVTTTPPGA